MILVTTAARPRLISFLPPRPLTPSSGRKLREIRFDGPHSLQIGKLSAFDYFGDGSFYLLDTPGHAVGHMCGLARTTCGGGPGSPSGTFVLLGGDACHYAGILRPSQHLPVPREIRPHPCSPGLDSSCLCPGSTFADLQRSRGRAPDDALYDMTFGHDIPLAITTLGHLQEFDCHEDVFVIIAHDATVRDGAPHFPLSLNDWKARGLGARLKWAFLRDLEPYWKTNDTM